MKIQIKDEAFILDYLKAVFHPFTESLIIADVHLGKSTHFRKNGIPIPINVAHNDLKRLSVLIVKYQPKKVIIAGDFFHASANSEIELFTIWRKQFVDVEFILIKGNHDRLAPIDYQKMNLFVIKETLTLGSFDITHHPKKASNSLVLCGHIHPGTIVQLNKRQKLRLPCFLLQENQLILPAFSEFTGLDTSLQSTGKNYVIAEETVFKIDS